MLKMFVNKQTSPNSMHSTFRRAFLEKIGSLIKSVEALRSAEILNKYTFSAKNEHITYSDGKAHF
jgi:hypothetical protein